MIASAQGQHVISIPSRINAHGVRVYIPEKGLKGARRWIKNYYFTRTLCEQVYPLLYSFGNQVTIPVAFSGTSITINAPFSLSLLQHYTTRAAQLSPRGAVVNKEIKLDNVPKPEQKLFNDNKKGDEEEDSRLLFALKYGSMLPK